MAEETKKEELNHAQIYESEQLIERQIEEVNIRWKKIEKNGGIGIIFGSVLPLIAIALYFIWSSQDALKCLDNMQTYLTLCKTIFGVGLFVRVIGVLVKWLFARILVAVEMCRVMQNSKYNYKQYIRKNCQNGQKQKNKYVSILVQSILFNENQNAKIWFYLNFAVKISLRFVVAIIFTCIACDLFPQIFAAKLLSIEFGTLLKQLYDSVKIELIIAVVFIVLQFACELICEIILAKRVKDKKNEILNSAK